MRDSQYPAKKARCCWMLDDKHLAGLASLVFGASGLAHVCRLVQGTICLLAGAVLVPGSLQPHPTQCSGQTTMGDDS